ncbi:MFS transporter [Facilibium subflavum]|uniref:MFS transporter n=1 Tax=Facilibium subflavum TaxID=2219058 RepID=UPI000E65D2FA|nr:MFS transporter [Facilibium subflavum]
MSQNQKMSLIGTIIWVVCAVFFMYEFLLRTILGTFEHPITYDLHLNLVTFAILSSTAYQLIYGIMQIPVGVIVDRFGLKKTLASAVFICAIAVAGFGFTRAFESAVIFRVLMGFGSSFGFVCLLVAVYDWMPRKNIGLFIGLSQFIGTMGPMLAAGPLDSLSGNAAIQWRYIFYALGGIGVALALIVLLIVRNNTDYTGSFRILKKPKPVTQNLYNLLKQPQVWLIAVFSACVYFTIEYLSENSGKAFLMLHGYTSSTASYMITVAWLGYAIGCPLLGFVSDLTSKRKNVMVLAAFSCLIAAVFIIYFPINIVVIILAFFLLGVGASGQSIGFAIMAEQCNHNYLAAGLGLNNGMIMLVTSLNAPFIGWILSMVSQNKNLSIGDYQSAFVVIIALMLLAVVISLFFIKETFCKSTKETTKLSVSDYSI